MDTTYTTYYWIAGVVVVAAIAVALYMYSGGTFTTIFGTTAVNTAPVTADISQ